MIALALAYAQHAGAGAPVVGDQVSVHDHGDCMLDELGSRAEPFTSRVTDEVPVVPVIFTSLDVKETVPIRQGGEGTVAELIVG